MACLGISIGFRSVSGFFRSDKECFSDASWNFKSVSGDFICVSLFQEFAKGFRGIPEVLEASCRCFSGFQGCFTDLQVVSRAFQRVSRAFQSF